MDWSQLLCSRRLGRGVTEAEDPHRSPFEVDLDRIVFSSAFRRLEGKTQVHGPAGNDYVRNRLTHSLEVSRVGRTLGTMVAARIAPEPARSSGATMMTPRECGHAVAAACAAHDFGTPCFAHQGEAMISDFFHHHPLGRALSEEVSPRMRAELEAFEGNAQGLRVLTRLQGWRPRGGLNLTMATLAAHAKYPYAADAAPDDRIKPNKYGYFDSEAGVFAEVAEATGMVPRAPGVWARHPLAFLVEAADDICYRIVDIEDAAVLGVITMAEAEDLLTPIIGTVESDYTRIDEMSRKLTYLRSRAISRLIEDAAEAFVDNFNDIRTGRFSHELIELSPVRPALARIHEVSRRRIYVNKARQDVDLKAGRVINTLLEAYCTAFLEREDARDGRLSNRSRTILRTFPDIDRIDSQNREAWLRAVLDYVTGMTDAFASDRAELMRM